MKCKKCGEELSTALKHRVPGGYIHQVCPLVAGGGEPAASKTPRESTLASANGSAAQVRNAILAYELLEKVKQILHATDEVAEDGCRLAATVIVNLERGTLKDDENGTLRKLAHNVLRQDSKQQNDKSSDREQ